MATVKYDGPFSGVVLPDGRTFPKGDPVEVTDELAKALAPQGFKVVTKSVKDDK